jgi:hypothetical protein
MEKFRNEEMPDSNSPACQLLQSKLECHMAEFNPRLLKELEDSGQLQEFLAEAASQAAGEVADQDLYPTPETSEVEDDSE